MARIKAFGAELSLCEWAEQIQMTAVDVAYYLEVKGLTIEDLFRIKGRKPKIKGAERKPRVSAEMVRTRERIGVLLENSGYIGPNELESIEVRRSGTHTHHAITFRGKPLGIYNYKTGGLVLSGGEGFPLWALEWEEAKIQIEQDGRWCIHPDTKKILFASHIKMPNEARIDEILGELKERQNQR